jgi:hypothetical protein
MKVEVLGPFSTISEPEPAAPRVLRLRRRLYFVAEMVSQLKVLSMDNEIGYVCGEKIMV